MCNKMTRLYSRFIGDMQEKDALLKILSHMCGTLAHEVDSNGNPRSYTGMSSNSMCPATHKVALNCGARQSSWDNVVVSMTHEEYNTKIKARINGSTEARALIWRNYLIDNGLVPKLIEIFERNLRSRNIGSEYNSWLADLKIQWAQIHRPTHERIAA